MRADVLRTLVALAEQDERVVFLTGDLGYGVVEPFFERFPERAYNAGVAEQNMVAMATGLAASGLIPFVYSIATFASLRPFEFIRNGPVIHDLRVRIIGVGGGMEYSNNGPTHFALDDVGALRVLPGLTIICPNDNAQACAAVEATYDQPGPIYFRLSKSDVAPADGAKLSWDGIGARVLHDGDGSVAVVALGAHARHLGAICAHLRSAGIEPTLASVAQIAPAPTDFVERLAHEHQIVATVEAHHVTGGLGSMVCEVIAEAGIGARVLRFGARTWPVGISGSEAHLDRWAGIDPESVAAEIAKQAAGVAATSRGS